jgi:hypothetical protein
MPEILESTSIEPLVTFVGYTDLQVSVRQTIRGTAQFHGKTTIQATPSGDISQLITFAGRTTIAVTPNAALTGSVTFAGATSIEIQLSRPPDFTASFTINLTVVPTSAPTQWLPYAVINNVEIPLIDLTVSEGAGGALTGDATVADMALAPDLVSGLVTAGIANLDNSGDWDTNSLIKLIENATITNIGYAIGWNGEPTDNLRFAFEDFTTQKLVITSEYGFILYDPLRIETPVIDYLFDSEGNAHLPEIIGINGLTFYKVLARIASKLNVQYQTNLPDFPIARFDVALGQRYLDALAPFIGMFEPAVFIRDGKLFVIDTTNALPPDFPAPLALVFDRVESLSIDNSLSNADAIALQYVQEGFDFDYVTIRNEVKSYSTGTFGNPDYQSHLVTTQIREYRRFDNPLVILREEVINQTHRISDNAGLYSEIRDNRAYDSLLRLTNRVIETYGRLNIQTTAPVTNTSVLTESANVQVRDTGGFALSYGLLERITERYRYSAHPFKNFQTFVERREQTREGLIIKDEASPQLNEPFRQQFTEARLNGNLLSGQRLYWTTVESVLAISRPLRDGKVETTTTGVNNLNSIGRTDTEINDGDAGIPAITNLQKRILVFETPTTTRSNGYVVSLHVGNLPLRFAIPLARRRLRQIKSRNRRLRATYLGYSPLLRVGSVIKAQNREGLDLGNYIILSVQTRTNASGLVMDIDAKEVG